MEQVHINPNGAYYIPHCSMDGLPVKITITQIYDENKVLNSLLINDSQKEEKEQYFIEAQLVIHGQAQAPVKYLKSLKKSVMMQDNSIIFPISIKELSYNSFIAITIWSTLKEHNEKSPLGSTTVPLFDENLRLREGRLNLLIWPNVNPDINFNTKTPGLVVDKNIDILNHCTQQIEVFEQTSNDTNQNLTLANLNLKLSYSFKTIPAAFIGITLPRFNVPVIFEDVEYPMDEQKQAILGGGYNQGQAVSNFFNIGQQVLVKQQPQKLFITQHTFSDTQQISDFDYEQGKPDPVQEMFNTLLRFSEHPETLKPTKVETEKLLKSLQRPIIGDMKTEEKQLFWINRYWSMQYGAALPKFLMATNWDSNEEEAESIKLLPKWAPIEIEDALFLLSHHFSANELKKNKRSKASMMHVRKHAVKALQQFNDEKIESVLLQLVAALKYETQDEQSPLCDFLFKRSTHSKQLATYLYWYLNVEQDTINKENKTLTTDWYSKIFTDFCYELESTNQELWKVVSSQFEFRKKLQKLSGIIKSSKADKNGRIALLRDKLSESEFQDHAQLPRHPCCLNPDIELLEAVPQSTTIFSSAMAPFRLSFRCLKYGKKDEFKLIFKNGDDLRQDQLVMQIFNLMDALLKGVSQDMKLLPYKIMACSKSDGFLEFVPQTITLQDILKKEQLSMSQYLKQISEDSMNDFYMDQLNLKNKDIKDPENQRLIKIYIEESLKGAKMGINPIIMNNYILSCAGYCVLTFFLGIGDRHLENLLVNNEGKMFHIDFGFILGKDPKPYPPPFKLCREMIEGMGGTKSEFYTLFKQKCVDVYLYLRRYAKLIINLFLLMSDAGIKDYSHEAIETMYEKFRLDDSDENAEIHLFNILEDSVNSLFGVFTDKIHYWASYWRK